MDPFHIQNNGFPGKQIITDLLGVVQGRGLDQGNLHPAAHGNDLVVITYGTGKEPRLCRLLLIIIAQVVRRRPFKKALPRGLVLVLIIAVQEVIVVFVAVI